MCELPRRSWSIRTGIGSMYPCTAACQHLDVRNWKSQVHLESSVEAKQAIVARTTS